MGKYLLEIERVLELPFAQHFQDASTLSTAFHSK